ncbi:MULTISPECIES: helix-turn-helix domain-containing protein [unclassified Nostoc]|uniref:helix-turn-helix domain-containing protein n=1 Tax=unclassified Nostoc TaxID=2593658 RepID=UPI0011801C65
MPQANNLFVSLNCTSVKQEMILTPFQRQFLLRCLTPDLRPEYRCRIEIMLMVDAGQSQAQICQTLECSQDTARYWIAMARAGKAHLWNEPPIGRPKTINEQYLDRLQELMNHTPRDYGYAFKRWTGKWLSKHLAKELGIEVSDRYVNQLLKRMGLSTCPKPNTIESSANSINNK